MSDSMLSQAEIDHLLNGGNSSDNLEAPEIKGQDTDIKPYDPNTQRRVVRERLHSLEIINERFARQFRIGLFNLLRRSTDVSVGNIIVEPYHAFARNLPVPTNLNIFHMNPLRGTALLVFSPNLVFMAIDTLFGGDGRFPTKVEGREFTPTEQRIINRILEMALEAYGQSWNSIFKLDVEYVRTEIQVKFTNITSSANDIVVTTPFHVEIGAHSGDFDICIPFSMIEPLRELLSNPPLVNSQQENEKWRTTLANQVKDTEVELIAQFAEVSTNLAKIISMQKGDVIPLEIEPFIEASVDGVPVLTAKQGAMNDHYALKVNSLINQALLSINKE